MGERFARAVMLVAAAAVFFALVCPLAATPMPVGKVKRLADTAAPVPIPLGLVICEMAVSLFPPSLSDALPVRSIDIADLSGVFIC